MGGCQSQNAVVVETAGSRAAIHGKHVESEVTLPGKPGHSGVQPREATHGSSDTGSTGERPRLGSYASAGSQDRSDDENSSNNSEGRRRASSNMNPKMLTHSASKVGLDEMIEDRREGGDLRQNVVHFEVPFGKPIEEVYEGVHTGPVLGSGISGMVRLVTHKATGIKYAVKVLDLALIESAEGLEQLREEIFIMCQLDHPNIVRLEEVYESHSEIYLVQELCLGGELFDRLDEQPDYHYTEAECARLVKQMLSAVRYLHSKGIIHRDLKLENFLFSSTAADSQLKMIDFGLSKHFRYGEVHHEAVGTPYTVAPEVIRGSYDERCDIWAIGVITFLLLSGDPPFGGCGGPEPLVAVRTNILHGKFTFEPEDIWEEVSDSARDFICRLLVTDPKKRPTARQAQKHEWFQRWVNRRNGNDNALNPNVVKALVNFKEYSDMRKLLCEVLSFTLRDDQIKDLRGEFEKMDTDGSGEISLSALKQVLMTSAGAGSLGALTEEEVEDIFNAMRVHKAETRIHWHEFIAAGLSQCQVDDRNLRLAFERLDSDHKGYIDLDDIMDLLGSDAAQSEEAMRQTWLESMKAVRCQHARITYDDFLLLMKGQTKDAPVIVEAERGVGMNGTLLMPSKKLAVVPEAESVEDDRPSDEVVAQKSVRITEEGAEINLSNHTPTWSGMQSRSAPSTPADHKRILEVDDDELELDSPLSMDNDDDIAKTNSASNLLTPPMTPERGARDYISPFTVERIVTSSTLEKGMLFMPNLPTSKPALYTRRRSRSVDDSEDAEEEKQSKDLHVVADAVRDMILPETDHSHSQKEFEAVVRDGSKSALVVNRKLYRAHRQMRLAVLDASKRFEESQAAHARDVILAQYEAEGKTDQGKGSKPAGLVMRHGHSNQVSSEAIRAWLQENRQEQQALVEKANKRGGRGRRSRKKTISDMSGMLASMGQDELGLIAAAATHDGDMATGLSQSDKAINVVQGEASEKSHDESDRPDLAEETGHFRGATVPGEFRKSHDPFGTQGRYGAVSARSK